MYDWTHFQGEIWYSPDESLRDRKPPTMTYFCVHIEKDQETTTTKKSDEKIKEKCQKKYGGLEFKYDNYGIIYTVWLISTAHFEHNT